MFCSMLEDRNKYWWWQDHLQVMVSAGDSIVVTLTDTLSYTWWSVPTWVLKSSKIIRLHHTQLMQWGNECFKLLIQIVLDLSWIIHSQCIDIHDCDLGFPLDRKSKWHKSVYNAIWNSFEYFMSLDLIANLTSDLLHSLFFPSTPKECITCLLCDYLVFFSFPCLG